MKKLMVVVSFVAIIALMVAAIPVGAVEDVVDPILNTYTVVDFIFAYMRALGYGFEVDAIEEWEEAVQSWILGEIYDFLDTIPSVSGLAQWILPWSLDWDGWGNMIGNNSFLEDMEDFLDYLNTKYNLENNIVQVVAPSWTFGEYQGFLNNWTFDILNYHTRADTVYSTARFWVGAYQPLYQCYGVFVNIGNESDFGIIMKSTGSFDFRYRYNGRFDNPNTVGPDRGNGGQYSSVLGENYYYYRFDFSAWDLASMGVYVGLPIYHFDSLSDALLAFDITDPSVGPNITISAGDIVLPGEDPDYNIGDGVTIIDENGEITKIYLEITFPDSINVKNLPAAIMPNQVEALSLADAFTPISSFINTYSDAIEVVTDISYRLPIPLWTIALALIAVDILAGIIHTLKEH